MAKRYELPDAAWDLVADIFSEPRRNGRPRSDDRLMLNGVLWELCSGLAEGEASHRYARRHTRKKLCGDGFTGLCHAVFATVLFVKSLEVHHFQGG